MTDIILSTQNGEPVASSRQIADNFEKRHDHVMRDIDAIKKDVPNFGEMFFETETPDSTAGSSGYSSTAAATGACCSAKADGKDSIAVVNGVCGKACGALGCYLVLTEYDDDGNMLWAKMTKVDGAHIKEKVWYTLKNGEFVEAEP